MVTAGVGSVTLTASPLAFPVFGGWSGTGCTSATNPLVLASSDLEHRLHGDVLAHLRRQDCASYDASSSSTVRTRPRAARLSALR